ncbi:MAG: flagellar biosynthetic protein FliR [Succinivibrionaceae bacterium]
MVQFSQAYLLDLMSIYILPFVRISSCLMAMFAIGSQSVPGNIKLALALAITIGMLPTIPNLPEHVDILSSKAFVLVGYQVIVGLALGFITQFISQIFVVAGQVVAMQTGLGFASMVDPVSGTNTPVIGQFFTVLATILFFIIDGHIVFFKMVHLSFTTLPMTMTGFFNLPFFEITKFGSVMFILAISMSISSICAMLLVNFTFGVMTKAAPQLNIFSMGFSVSLICGIIVLKLVLSSFMSHYIDAVNKSFELGCSFIGISCNSIF